MKIELKRIEEPFVLKATNEAGNEIIFDANESIGGLGKGIRPKQALASSLAACSTIDVLLILGKQKIEVKDYAVDVDVELTDDVPAVFKNVHLNFKLKGVPRDKAERAVDLSVNKYCSIIKMIEKTSQITYSIDLD